MKRLLPLVCLAIAFCACAPKQEAEAPAESATPQATAPQPVQPAQPSAPAQPTPPAPTRDTAQTPPSDFPLPIMEGLKVASTTATSAGDYSGTQVALTGSVPADKVIQFYEAEFQKRGLQIRKTTMEDESLLLGESEQVTAGVIVSPDKSTGAVQVVLSWSQRK